MLDIRFFDKHILIRWEKRYAARKTWRRAKSYFQRWTKREEVYDLSIGGITKKARFESSLNAREQREPAPEQRDDKNAIGADNAIGDYLDDVTAASTVKEERMRES